MSSDALDALLELRRPIARGASRCHVLALRDDVAGTMIAACGVACGSCCEDANFEPGVETCPMHDEELCAACVEIVEGYLETGDWRGVSE